MEPGLPQSIEVRVAGRNVRHLIDYDAILKPEYLTLGAYCTMAAHALMELRGKLIEDAILEGHDRVEVQIEGDGTTVFFAPNWYTETRAWLKVKWARWRHPRARV
jgi:hypothetical protein